jgi:hypothetical protein
LESTYSRHWQHLGWIAMKRWRRASRHGGDAGPNKSRWIPVTTVHACPSARPSLDGAEGDPRFRTGENGGRVADQESPSGQTAIEDIKELAADCLAALDTGAE